MVCTAKKKLGQPLRIRLNNLQGRGVAPPLAAILFCHATKDGVVKTLQLLRCCNCSRCFGVRKYASLFDNCAPCIWRFLLSHHYLYFLLKASQKSMQKRAPELLARPWRVPSVPLRFAAQKKTRLRLRHFSSKPCKAALHSSCVTRGKVQNQYHNINMVLYF